MLSRSHHPRGAFLVTLGLGFLIILIMVLVSVPVMRHTRADDQRKECLENLARINAAKERYAVDEEKPKGTPVDFQTLIAKGVLLDADSVPLKIAPLCPSCGQQYSVNPLGTLPTCPYGHGHALPPYKVKVIKPAKKG